MRLPKLPGLIIGIVIAVSILAVSFVFMQRIPGRASDQQPRDVIVSDISTDSVKISYATGNKTQGVIEYGVSPTALNLLAPEDESAIDHEVELTLLSKGTTYYFQISIAGKKFDNSGVPWTFSTKSSDNSALFEEVTPTTTVKPTPINRVLISEGVNPCEETSCTRIKQKLGQGCTTQDYIKCLKRNPPTQAPLTTP